jgi:hypothetical protein
MAGEITRQLYIYTITADARVLDYLENTAGRNYVSGLFYRAKHRGSEQFKILDQTYEVRYDGNFRYHVIPIYE